MFRPSHPTGFHKRSGLGTGERPAVDQQRGDPDSERQNRGAPTEKEIHRRIDGRADEGEQHPPPPPPVGRRRGRVLRKDEGVRKADAYIGVPVENHPFGWTMPQATDRYQADAVRHLHDNAPPRGDVAVDQRVHPAGQIVHDRGHITRCQRSGLRGLITPSEAPGRPLRLTPPPAPHRRPPGRVRKPTIHSPVTVREPDAATNRRHRPSEHHQLCKMIQLNHKKTVPSPKPGIIGGIEQRPTVIGDYPWALDTTPDGSKSCQT